MKRLTICLAIGLALALVISFSAIAQEEEVKKEEILFWTWAGGREITMLESKITRFEFIYPDIKVKMQPLPFVEYQTKLLSGHASGTAPDVAYYSQVMHKMFYDRGLLEDLWPYVKDDKVWLADYRPFLLDVHTFDSHYVGTGLGGWGTAMIFYNVDMFEENGIEGPPKTWEEYLDIAKRLTKDTNGDGKTNIFGCQNDGSFETYLVLLESFGGGVFNEDRSETIIDSPESIEAMQFWGELINEEKVHTPWVGTPGGVGFTYNNVAMGVYGIWSNGFWTTIIGDKFKFDIAPNPVKVAKSAPLSSSAYGVAIGSKHKDAAVKLAKYMASAAGQIENAFMGFAASSNPSLDFMYANSPVWAGKDYQALAETADYGKLMPLDVPRWEEVLRVLTKQRDLVLIGQETAEKAMEDAAKTIRDIMAGKEVY